MYWNILTILSSVGKYVLCLFGDFSSVSYNSMIFVSMNSIQLESDIGDVICATSSNFFLANMNSNKWYNWIGDNILIVDISCIMTVYAVFITTFIIVKLRHKNLKFSLWNYFMKLSMLSYYTLTYVSLHHLLENAGHVSLTMVAIMVLFFNTFCLPAYIYVVLKSNKTCLKNAAFQRMYGSVYMEYKAEHYIFTCVLLVKQFIYAVLFALMSSKIISILTSLTAQFLVNTIYSCLLIKNHPFKLHFYMMQAFMVVAIKYLIIVSLYMHIFFELDVFMWFSYGANMLIYVTNIVTFVIVLIYVKKNLQRDRLLELQKIQKKTNLPFWVVQDYMKDKEIPEDVISTIHS